MTTNHNMKKLLRVLLSVCLVQQLYANEIVIRAQKPLQQQQLLTNETEFPQQVITSSSSNSKFIDKTQQHQQLQLNPNVASSTITNDVGEIVFESNAIPALKEKETSYLNVVSSASKTPLVDDVANNTKQQDEHQNVDIPSSISLSVASGGGIQFDSSLQSSHENTTQSASTSTILTQPPATTTIIPTTTSTTEAPTTTSTTQQITTAKAAVNNDNMLIPPADVHANIAKIDTPANKKGQVIISSKPDCPSLESAANMSQTQLIQALTHECRYDRLERPILKNVHGEILPVDVYVRLYFYFLQNLEAHDLQFKIQALLQLRFVDPRLVFKEVDPSRTSSIMGEATLRSSIWVPHIFLVNEKDSSILGTEDKDILTSISPDGTVIISARIQATLSCWMNLQKFPFDEQECSTVLESWMYNTSELEMHWETKSPVTLAPKLHLTEYVLLNSWTNSTVVNADTSDLSHGAFAGNYSSLSFTIHIAREMGFYLMDYFLPSMMIVSISWVTFWLQADQTAPRVMLGTTTMLTFITLASGQAKTLPKVSYIKVSEVWFLGCTGFIFGSLVEFAFVNTIWRRKKNVELKKVNSKYILKSTLTPRPHRKEMGGLQKSRSCSSLDAPKSPSTPTTPTYNNYLTVHSFNSKSNLPTITTQSVDDVRGNGDISINIDPSMSMSSIPGQKDGIETPLTPGQDNNHYGWTTMTPQEISTWIDRRSRLVFPCAFVVFNAFFWTFIYCL